MRKAAAISLLLALLANAQPREDAGIIYGPDHAFALKAPKGWVLDNASGRGQGLCAVLYPEGQSWAQSEVVMYANTASKHVAGQRTLEELIAYDVAQFQSRAPNLKVEEATAIKANDRTATVRRFEGDEHGNHEAVAYIDEKNTIVMLVLSARSKEQFEKAYPAFEEMVASYRFLTSDVRIQK